MARLPKSRSRVVDSEFGYQEPEIIPEGKITLKQVMNILVQHQEDGKKYNASYFSSQYKLTEEDAGKQKHTLIFVYRSSLELKLFAFN